MKQILEKLIFWKTKTQTESEIVEEEKDAQHVLTTKTILYKSPPQMIVFMN